MSGANELWPLSTPRLTLRHWPVTGERRRGSPRSGIPEPGPQKMPSLHTDSCVVYEKTCRWLWGHPRERDKASLQTRKTGPGSRLLLSLQVSFQAGEDKWKAPCWSSEARPEGLGNPASCGVRVTPHLCPLKEGPDPGSESPVGTALLMP